MTDVTSVEADHESDTTELPEELEVPDRDLVGQYLSNIGKESLLTAEEEVQLAQTIEAGLFAEKLLAALQGEGPGDPEITESIIEKYAHVSSRDLTEVVNEGKEAYQRFIRANLRLVVSVAKKYSRSNSLPFLDNIQEGNLGVVRAVEKFDYTKGYKFSTYATWWIRQAITRGEADNGRVIRLPVHTVELVNKSKRVRRDMTNDLGREPTEDEVAAKLGMDKLKFAKLMRDSRTVVSLDAPIGDDSETSFGDLIVSDDGQEVEEITKSILKTKLHEVLERLTARERDVMIRRFGMIGNAPETLDDIAKSWGITRERVRQIERSAKNQLHDYEDLAALNQAYGGTDPSR